ncbi:MAG: hypothetical protein COY40_04250 [Alphaproteobacteria bacterium CG_4_10_14_0_8_um_filter_53_9]|nr:MAG: hypothetical protein COY40_04250 [Alphaproteobacteria bacterium CG_4_10_14_0_8_um_filter_53_9]
MNPKMNLIRTACRKLAPTFRRYYGEVGRALINPVSAASIAEETFASVKQVMVSELEKAGFPIVTSEEPIPNGPHFLIQPLTRKVNFAHGRLPVSCAVAFVEEDGTCLVGAVYFPVEDVLVQAEVGSGAIGQERFRATTRADLNDSLLALPWSTEDLIHLNLLEKCEKNPTIHTRKTGDSLFDMIDVASGRADIAIATRLTRLEALLAKLILHESNATGTDLEGNPLTAKSTTLLAASYKLHPTALTHFKTKA